MCLDPPYWHFGEMLILYLVLLSAFWSSSSCSFFMCVFELINNTVVDITKALMFLMDELALLNTS